MDDQTKHSRRKVIKIGAPADKKMMMEASDLRVGARGKSDGRDSSEAATETSHEPDDTKQFPGTAQIPDGDSQVTFGR